MSRSLRILLTVIVGIVGTFACLTFMALSNRPRNTAPAPTRAPYTITGANGTIRVPSTMYIEAFDPATNSNIPQINVWREVGRGSQPPACQLEDGDEIAVDNSSEDADGIWIHITAGRCTGWVLSEFVTSRG